MIGAEASATLAALRSGTPAVVVPLTPFQDSWASAVQRARCGRQLSRAELLEPAMLLQALQFCASSECAASAAAVRAQLLDETDIAATCAADCILADLARLRNATPP